MTRSSSLAALLATALCGCFEDPPAASSGSSSDDGASSSASEDPHSTGEGDDADTTAATQGGGSVSSTSPTDPDTGSSDDASTAEDASTTDEPGRCGELGQACCASATCDAGQCHGNTCIAFRGAFADPLPCAGCQANEHLTTLADCECDGFPQSEAFSIDTDTCMPELPSVAANLFTCAAVLDPDATGSDWGGAHMLVTESSCADINDPCVVPNQYTGACECPPDMDAITAALTGPCMAGGGGSASYQLVVCSSSAVAPITFGGAYQTLDGDVCAEGNPRAEADCECPTGFDAQGLRIISSATGFGSTLVFCVGGP